AVDGEIVNIVKFAGVAAFSTERADHFASLAYQCAHFLVGSIGVHQERLLGVRPEVEIPGRAPRQSVFGDKELLYESAVLAEDLDAIVCAVTHINETVLRYLHAVDRIGELFRWLPCRIVGRRLGIARWLSIGAPMTLVSAGIRVKHDDAMVAITIG